jgi:hypothetical protein
LTCLEALAVYPVRRRFRPTVLPGTILSASQTVSAWGTAPTQPGGYGAAPIRERCFDDLSNADRTVVHVLTGSSPARGGEDYGLDAAYSQKGHDELDVSDDEDVEHNPGSSPWESSPGRDLNGTHRKKKKQVGFWDHVRSPDRVCYPSLAVRHTSTTSNSTLPVSAATSTETSISRGGTRCSS